jgi:hypothetical protein
MHWFFLAYFSYINLIVSSINYYLLTTISHELHEFTLIFFVVIMVIREKMPSHTNYTNPH